MILSPKLSSLVYPLFSTQIPGVSESLVSAKSYDLVEFGVTFVLGLFISITNIFLFKKVESKEHLLSTLLISAGVITFLLTKFATYSGRAVFGIVIVVELFILLLAIFSSRKKISSQHDNRLVHLSLLNGIFLGFFCLLAIKLITPIVIIPLSALVLIPIINLYFSYTYSSWAKQMAFFPGFLVPAILLFPTDLSKIVISGATILLIWGLSTYLKRTIFPIRLLSSYILPSLLVFLAAYNPTFVIGNFDSVEEGFWSAWVQRLLQGDVLYKDVMVYHPPVFIWGLYVFEKLVGVSLVSQRLFMHLLQVAGAIIYLFFIKRIIKSRGLVILLMLVYFGLTTTAVKNNVEIRVGLGLLSLLAISYSRFSTAGALAAISLFSSVEVGLASIVSGLAFSLFQSKNRLKSVFSWSLGFVIGSLPILAILAWLGSLGHFINQITFYASIFSQGYFNSPVDRAISLSFFHWHIFNQFFGSPAMWYELIKLVTFSSVIYGLLKLFFKKALSEDNLILSTAIMAGVLTRVALGRSDYLHLLFPLLVVIALVGYGIDRLNDQKPNLAVLLTTILVMVLAREGINSAYLENLSFRLQTYGSIVDEFHTYKTPRAVGIQRDSRVTADSENELISYIQSNTTAADSIFTYPWYPELYFITDRKNATSVDTPYAFYTPEHQKKILSDLSEKKPKYVIYNPDMNFGGLSVGSLSDVDNYIKSHYKVVKQFGKNQVLESQ